MRRREPPKEKSNVGPRLPHTAVAGLLRALRGVRAGPNRPARFDNPAAARGPTGYYSPEAMIELAQRLERLAAKGAKARISVTPETANLWARALRAYAARPSYDDVLEAMCTKKDCAIRSTCMGCRGKANLIVQVFEGHADFSLALKRER
jgi:hypothetical protein